MTRRACSGAAVVRSAGGLDDVAGRPVCMVEVQRGCPLGYDVGFDRSGVGVLAPVQAKVGAHPVSEASLVLGDQHDAVGAFGPVAVLGE